MVSKKIIHNYFKKGIKITSLFPKSVSVRGWISLTYFSQNNISQQTELRSRYENLPVSSKPKILAKMYSNDTHIIKFVVIVSENTYFFI